MKKKKILFVCTGNTCRSVIAELLFKKMLAEAQEKSKNRNLKNIDVFSAGIAPIPGINTAPGTLKVLQEEGIDGSCHKSRKLTPDIARDASVIIVMEERQMEEIRRMPGASKYRLFHLDSFPQAGPDKRDVPDPFGHSIEMYRECMEIIREHLEGLLKKLTSSEI